MEITISNKWRYKIRIKDQFEKETTPELIVKLCDSLVKQLRRINDQCQSSNLLEDEKDWADTNLFEIIDLFEFLKRLANGEIKESEWDDYEFDGRYESTFNSYLSYLYDIANTRVVTKGGVSEKFIWIG